MSYLVNVLKEKNVRGFFPTTYICQKILQIVLFTTSNTKKDWVYFYFHIYILQFGPDCKINASVWNIHHHKLSRVFLVDKNCACWQWPTYYEIKEGRRQRHKKDRFWVNGPLWRIVFQFFFFFWSDQVWKMVINMFIGVVNMYSFIRKVMME